MTEKHTKKIFEKYNPKSEVVRCPKGRAFVRSILDEYARAAVHLYGVISKADFVDIFNRQNVEQTTEEEMFILLLPLVLKNGDYCFYKDYIVHYWLISDFDNVGYFLREQEGKPRYVPEREEFLAFAAWQHESKNQEEYWLRLLDFVREEWPESYSTYLFYRELKELSFLSNGSKIVGVLLEKYNLAFKSDKNVQMFYDRYTDAMNNTRLWHNQGYSPMDIVEITRRSQVEEGSSPLISWARIKIGQNDPCPCGSGKKYKKCCKRVADSRTAQLTDSECVLFYVTWYGLLGFVNKKKNVIRSVIKPIYPNPIGDDQILRVRDVLWENTRLIDDYLRSEKLPEDQTELLESWSRNHKKGEYILTGYTLEYALMIGTIAEAKEVIYAVKGISEPLCDIIQRALPVQLETVLLPFKDRIINDGFMKLYDMSFSNSIRRLAFETKEKAIQEQSIICSLKNG
ncbi:MAG: SEC-C metal-binding domain-containing protein [Saccharofermentanales bacterium]